MTPNQSEIHYRTEERLGIMVGAGMETADQRQQARREAAEAVSKIEQQEKQDEELKL